jgi:hypothetical protein
VLTTLKYHRREQVEERVKAGPDYENNGLVFAASNGSPLDWKAVAPRHFRPILERAKITGLRPYDLRHTCATLLLGSGENVKVVSERRSKLPIVSRPSCFRAARQEVPVPALSPPGKNYPTPVDTLENLFRPPPGRLDIGAGACAS